MSWCRISLSTLMAVVVVLAGDAAILRAWYSSLYGSSSVLMSDSRVLVVLGVLPMASLLILIALVCVPKLIQTGRPASFLLGFAFFGCAAVLGFVVMNVLAPGPVSRYLELGLVPAEWVIRWLLPAAEASVRLPDSLLLEEILDCTPVALLLGAPELAVAVLGGWLVRWAGILVRFEWRRGQSVPTGAHEAVPGPPIKA